MPNNSETKIKTIAVSPETYEEIRQLAFDIRITQGELIARAIKGCPRELLEEGVKKDESIPMQKL